MTRLRIETIPSTASVGDCIKALQDLIQDKPEVSETTGRNFIIRLLARLGCHKTPNVRAGRVDGSTVRVYTWVGSPLGDLFLAGGPQLQLKVGIIQDLAIEPTSGGLYALLAPDQTSATKKAGDYASRLAAVSPKPAKAPPKPREAPAPRAPRATRAARGPTPVPPVPVVAPAPALHVVGSPAPLIPPEPAYVPPAPVVAPAPSSAEEKRELTEGLGKFMTALGV